MNDINFWNDERVKEFYTFCYKNVFKQPTSPEEMVEQFKSSHSSANPEPILEKYSRYGTVPTGFPSAIIEEVGWEIVEGESVGGKHKWFPDNSHGGDSCIQSGCKIFSVRRKSDGEVFSVGDRIGIDIDIEVEKFGIDKKNRMTIKHGERIFLLDYVTKRLPKRTRLFTELQRIEHLEERIAYIEKKLNIEG